MHANDFTALDAQSAESSLANKGQNLSDEEIRAGHRAILLRDIQRDIEREFDRQFTEWWGDSDGSADCD